MKQIINSDLITSHIKELIVLGTEFAVLMKENFCCIYLSAVIDFSGGQNQKPYRVLTREILGVHVKVNDFLQYKYN